MNPFFHQHFYRYCAFVTLVCEMVRTDKVEECCRSQNVPDNCVKTLCNPLNAPDDFDVYDIFQKKNNCSKHLPKIAQCLADGRDHSQCCESEAKDRDETACFGLCEGSGHTTKGWPQYQTCLAINLPVMFSCFQRGYQQSPSPPRNLHLDSIETTSITITWDTPTHNPDRVTKYLLYLLEKIVDAPDNAMFVKGLEPKELQMKVDGTSTSINDLQPGTVYNAHVIALGQNPEERSLSSDILTFQTGGIAPKVHPYSDVVHAPEDATSVVLACRIHMSSVSKGSTKFEWHHKTAGGSMKLLEHGLSHNISHYVFSYERPREYVTTLEIKKVDKSSFGLYQCSVSDKYGNAEAEVQLALTSDLNVMEEEPPATSLECCKDRGVEQKCLPMCGQGHDSTDSKRYIPRPFMPTNCSGMIGKVLSCAMTGVNDGACCLKEHVPRPCMYLCDSSIAPTNHMDPMCIQHIASVEKCRVHGVNQRPNVPDVKVDQPQGSDATIVRWDPVANALLYRLYWRKHGQTEWEKKTSTNKLEQVNGAEEVVVVAVNSFGLSQAARFNAQNGKWSRS